MKKKILILTTILLLLSVPLTLLGWTFLVSAQYDATFLGALQDKYDRLAKTPGKRIVLVGGSSVAFGVDSALLEEAFPDYRVVNFGMYAALGTTVMLDLSRELIREGDLVILIPEQQAQTLSGFFDPAIMWQGVDGAYGLLRHLPGEKLEKMLGAWPSFAGEKFRYFLLGTKPRPTGVYCRASFEEHGDILADLCPRNVMNGGWDANTPILFDPGLLSEGFVDQVNDYAAALEKKGATLWYGACPMNRSAVDENADVDGFYEALVERLSCPLIGDPKDSLLESGWFFDTNFHLNGSGKRLYTRNLIRSIKAMLGDSSPTRVSVPTMPEPAAPELTEGSNEALACFSYAISDGRVTVTGLTDRGREAEVLTVPVSWQGLPVTEIGENAFSGARALREVVLQKNIRSIRDGAFQGCPALERIVLQSENPAACQVGQGLLEGTGADILVPVQALSDYRTDYFWSIYASRIYPLA